MRVNVKAKTRSARPGIEEISPDSFLVRVKEPPVDNEANFAIIKALADHFHCPFSSIRLISGRSASNKIFEID
jgi:uncharacterized protein YggU (UPF0235/DUF167 family)